MKEEFKDLLEIAQNLVGEFQIRSNSSAGSVAAALKTSSDNIYTGICLDFPSGLGFCAEHSAIAEMLKNREREIKLIVAVKGDSILAPCGRCRELIAQVSPQNDKTRVLVEDGTEVTMMELLPQYERKLQDES